MIKFISKNAENLFVIVFILAAIAVGVLLYFNTKLTFVNHHLEYELVETQNKLNEQLFINQALERGQWEELE